MTGLLATAQLAAAVLGAWTLASLLAVAPVVGWLRLQAGANAARDRAERRRAWREAARPR